MQLHRRQDELRTLHAEVLLLTFSSAEQARRWRDETGVEFPLLLDVERRVYRAYGLRSSVWRVWQPKVAWRYTQLMLAGRRWRGIRDDPHQLGGDFIVDPQGIVRFAHSSADPTDRPEVTALLAVIGQSRTNL